MSLLTVSEITKSFGVDLLFDSVAFSLAAGQKMGLVGRNGSGKTTLLRIVLGKEIADSGRISLASGRRLGYLEQESLIHPERTVREEADSVFDASRAIEKNLRALERDMEANPTDMERLMHDYGAEQDRFELAGGYRYAADLDLVLSKLGFSSEDHTKRVTTCSGGEQTRLALAKIVLSHPDLLVLDEPTNHLDIAAVEWLEGFLKSYDGAVLLVSHDRYFLDSVCDTIADLDSKSLTVYSGNYSKFWSQKQDALVRQRALFEQQQADINRLEGIVRRNMGADSVQSGLRRRTQGRIERMDKVDRPIEDRTVVKAKFDAESAGRVGREVLVTEELTKSFGGLVLFEKISFVIERGQRIGLVGPNGSGKSTLVKIILGDEQADRGLLSTGHNARVSYFSQHASQSLDPERSVLDSLLDVAVMTETEARNHLARFLFVGDDVFKPVSVLSGGEKNKLALARMIVEPCNLLILDEPTNHLDIMSCEALTAMLKNYPGTLLLVSHDRYLLNAVTNRTLALTGGGRVQSFDGNYEQWRLSGNSTVWSGLLTTSGSTKAPVKKKAGKETQTVPESPPFLNARELSKARTKAREAVATAEEAVGRIEEKIGETELALAQPCDDPRQMVALAAEHTRHQDRLIEALLLWEQSIEELDRLESSSLARTAAG